MSEKKLKLSTDPYKGVRDFYPEDMAVLKHLMKTWRETAEKFGYVEYSASPLEPAELYEAKTGEEIVRDQTYTFTDRGGRKVTLRPEMTPTVARMVAGKKRELTFPLRWYSIPNVFRYEQPQRGRLREHYQLNLDLFGVESSEADSEIITVAYEIMKALGAKESDFSIRVNSRADIKNGLSSDLTEDEVKKYLSLVDKKAKIGTEGFESAVQKEFGRMIEYTGTAGQETTHLLKNLKERGINNCEFDPAIVRGFDYYTGMVFEVFDTDPANRRSIFGGGRYDDLTELFGGEKIPAVGFGMGDVTARDFLETHALLPSYSAATHLYIAHQKESLLTECQKIAGVLRGLGIKTAVDHSARKVGDQIKTADRQKIPFVLVIGEEEVSGKGYKLKKLDNGEEVTCSTVEAIADKIKNSLPLT